MRSRALAYDRMEGSTNCVGGSSLVLAVTRDGTHLKPLTELLEVPFALPER